MVPHFLLWLLLVVSGAAHASEFVVEPSEPASHPEAVQLIDKAFRLDLGNDSHWLRLLHFPDTAGTQYDSQKSDIITPEFFLATEGASDPNAELRATINAFFQKVGDDPNNHPRCRYPARYTWLKSRLNWTGIDMPDSQCEKMTAWARQGEVRSISLIFASGFLSNPASLFGHLLIKFNTGEPAVSGSLLDPSMSYGAIVPENENGIFYAVRGLFGGYPAGFSHDKFFLQNHNYTETELRDLWEYELDLSPTERDEIIAHSWELLHVRFRYFFLSDNCAFRVADLLSTTIEEAFLPNRPWSAPSSVIDQAMKIQRDGKPLVNRLTYLPSRQNRLFQKYSTLPPSQQQAIRNVIDDFQTLGEKLDSTSTTGEKIALLETLFDYYEYRNADLMKKNHFGAQKQQLLLERMKLPIQNTAWIDIPVEPPHEGQPPSLMQASAIHNNHFGNELELRVRPVYYDMLETDQGRIPYSALSVADTRIAVIENRIRFKSLHLLTIENMNISKTGLPGDGGYSWRLSTGLEQQDLSCFQCTIAFGEGGIGKAVKMNPALLIFGMAEGRAQTRYRHNGKLAITGRIGAMIDIGPAWRSGISLGNRVYLDGSKSHEKVMTWENRIGNDHGWDIRLGYQRHIAKQVLLSASIYW